MRSIKIDLGGKEREFSFRIRALGNVLLDFDNDIEKYLHLLQTNGFLTAPATLYHLHSHAVARAGQEVDFTIDDVEDWLDELEGKYHNKDVQRVLSEFVKTLQSYVPVVDKPKETTKKK